MRGYHPMRLLLDGKAVPECNHARGGYPHDQA